MKTLILLLCLMCAALPCLAEAPDTIDLSLLTETLDVTPAFTPGRERCGKEGCYWETPMDAADTEAVWAMLTAPMTVLRGDAKTQTVLRSAPSEDSEAIGDITRRTQGVHVLEDCGNGWSRIECYSSSFSGSRIKAWNQLVTGYVPTDALMEVQVKTKYGFVVDKLDQRLYIYREGALLDVLAVSTGKPTESEPYNETRSGEYLLHSLSGAFPSEKMTCNYGIRYNDGDLLHEVPHIKEEDGDANYGYTEPHLGQRASHGCIRVQRKRSPEGINMRWIWNELYQGQTDSRLVIWEDWEGRSIAIPDDDTPLYYNPKGGKSYHRQETCFGVRERYLPLTAFTYSELNDEPYAELTACEYCFPPRRAEDIAAINEAHLPADAP